MEAERQQKTEENFVGLEEKVQNLGRAKSRERIICLAAWNVAKSRISYVILEKFGNAMGFIYF